jgi:hypothetical protein
VINWFQHRRQREPEKEKGGYVKNNSHSVEGTPAGITSSTPNGDTSNIPSFQDYNGKTTANGVAGKNGLLNSTNSVPAIPPLGPNGATVVTSAAIAVSKPVIPVNGTKPAPYYGRMQTVRPPNMSEAGNNGDIVPKSANAHIGQMRWELDPLYIAPYVLKPFPTSSSTLNFRWTDLFHGVDTSTMASKMLCFQRIIATTRHSHCDRQLHFSESDCNALDNLPQTSTRLGDVELLLFCSESVRLPSRGKVMPFM